MRLTPRYAAPSGFFRHRPGSGLLARVAWREIVIDDDEYPDGLRTMTDPPDRLWIVGRDLRSFGTMITVIGARRANQYGLAVAHRLAADLAVGGLCIVSGMARGCDAAAHDGALEAGGATIAVLGSGVNVCYPVGSRALYAEIAAKGAIISATPPGHAAHKHDFVYRNDIMVALSAAVVVVQGDRESAAVKTGIRAAGRGHGNVFAVPGSIEWPQSEGVHGLLKDKAAVCTQASDIADALALGWSDRPPGPIPDHLPVAQKRVLEILSRGPAGREQIITETGLAASEVTIAITHLELGGSVVEEGFLLRRTR